MNFFSLGKKDLQNVTNSTRALREGVEQVRRQIYELREQQRSVERAPVDEAEARRRLDDWVSRLRASAADHLTLSDFISANGVAQLPTAGSHIIAAAIAPLLGEMYSVLLDRHYEKATGVSGADREATRAKIVIDLLAAEMAEESIIRNAEREGITILRRREADPRAVLAFDKDLP